jgi:hypothetical protein
MTTARDIAVALGGRQLGDDASLCRCPCRSHKHGDRNPSLSVCSGRNGRLLLHCFAGDRFDDVVAALREKGLRL